MIVRHRPQSLGAELGDAGAVDGVVVVVCDLVAVQQQHGVADVLLVELDDLQLGQQQLGQRHRRSPGLSRSDSGIS